MLNNELTIYEEVMLLALKDEEGTIAAGTMYNYAVGGAIAAELLLRNRIEIDRSNRKKLVSVVSNELLGDSLLDEWLIRMSSSKRRKSLQNWVTSIANTREMKHRIAVQLCSKGILKMEQGDFLFIFKRRVYPEINPGPERQIIARLEHAIFSESDTIDSRTVVLLSLAKSSNILPVIFDKRAIKQRKQRTEQIVNGELAGAATKEAIDAMQAAVMVTCIMPAVISSSSH